MLPWTGNLIYIPAMKKRRRQALDWTMGREYKKLLVITKFSYRGPQRSVRFEYTGPGWIFLLVIVLFAIMACWTGFPQYVSARFNGHSVPVGAGHASPDRNHRSTQCRPPESEESSAPMRAPITAHSDTRCLTRALNPGARQ